MKNLILKNLLTAFAVIGISTAATAEDAFSVEQKAAIEAIIADYVSNHPEIIVASMQKLETNMRVQHEKNVQKAQESIRSRSDLPYIGKKGASKTVIEFFDIHCGYCKIMEPMMKKLVKEHQDIAVYYVNYPVFGKESQRAAVLGQAIYSVYPDKYALFHEKIMSSETPSFENDDDLKKLVEDMGMKWSKIEEEIKSGKPQTQIQQNLDLGPALGITGTPYFIINGQEFRGAIPSYEMLESKL